jgi:hypothetical protein
MTGGSAGSAARPSAVALGPGREPAAGAAFTDADMVMAIAVTSTAVAAALIGEGNAGVWLRAGVEDHRMDCLLGRGTPPQRQRRINGTACRTVR